MGFPLKSSHNYYCLLTPEPDHTQFHAILEKMAASKYHTLWTTTATVYPQIQQEFWAKMKIDYVDKQPIAINSTIRDIPIRITPELISSTFNLADHNGVSAFSKAELRTEFTEQGYEGSYEKDTLEKGLFFPPMRFLFHTLLTCASNKTTSFNEIPLKIQYLAYAILHNQNFNYSQVIFNDLIKNKNNPKTPF